MTPERVYCSILLHGVVSVGDVGVRVEPSPVQRRVVKFEFHCPTYIIVSNVFVVHVPLRDPPVQRHRRVHANFASQICV